ncbi:hypothetical protein KFK09_013831 [Dendrobium nobile]|uniref:Reverse transcriptase domain-containing protein n=1 Tax=Dendrobium nobile TaxID=94219 RepID=A0A8T3B8C7_DENNO|nr:hypothetical protein KFK09_013831 [Dendrobium nobile]
MDALSCLIEDNNHIYKFEGFHYGDFHLSHLSYADDLLVFGKADTTNCDNLMNILNRFSCLSGLNLNLHKSSLLFPPSANISSSISQALYIHTCSTTIPYLGIPIALGRTKLSDFYPLLDKITNMLSGWKAKLLSFAGQPSIVKLFSGSIILIRNFPDGSKLATLSFMSRIPIAILWDNWCSNGSLLDSFPHFDYSAFIQDSTTLANWMDGCSWFLPSSLPSQMADFITSIPIANSASRHLAWENNENATFKDFYKEYFAYENDVDWAYLVWHKKHSLRHFVYSWMALSNGLKTSAALSARNIVIMDLSCPLCHLHPETTAHLLLECNYSFQVICKLIPQFTSFLLRPNIAQAFQFISGFDSSKEVKLGLLLILNVTVYFIWTERNSRKFNGRISCAITLAKKISNVVYLKLDSWKCGNSVKEKLMVKYH